MRQFLCQISMLSFIYKYKQYLRQNNNDWFSHDRGPPPKSAFKKVKVENQHAILCNVRSVDSVLLLFRRKEHFP